MNIKNLLGKLSIGRAGVSTGAGNIVRTGAPEDAFRSGVAEFVRKAQTEEPIAAGMGAQTSPKRRMTHPVMLVSRFKYPYVKTKSVPGEEGEKPTKVETGELGWKTTPNKDVADEAVNGLYAYVLYLYEDTATGQDLVLGQPIEEQLAKSKATQQPLLDASIQPTHVDTPDWYKAQKSQKAKPKRVKKSGPEDTLKRFAAAGEAGDIDAQTNDYSSDREIESAESRYKFKGKIVRFTTDPSNPEGQAAKFGAHVVPASSMGYRAYEVMPSAVAEDLYVEPDGEDPSKVPTWTKSIKIPTEESPSAYGTSFRYRFSNGEPIPTLNGNKHVLSELLSVNGEKAPKDPGMNADFNIYEFMTANDLWGQMDNSGRLPSAIKTQIADAESEIQSAPELEHFTLGGGSLINLGGKKDSIMSEENLLARALYHLRNPSMFTYVNTDGTEAFRPRVADEPNIAPLATLDKQLHAARQAYRELYEQLSPAERKASPELAEAAERANQIGIKFVDLMAAKYPSKLREFALKQPYVGHAPSGEHNKPGGKHESAYSLSPTSHLSDQGKTLATYESGGGLQKLNDDDRKLYALVKSFERNADNALNNQAKTLHNQKHAKLVESPSESGEPYKIPTPRDAGGEWSEAAGKSIDFMENHWLQNHFLSAEDRTAISELQNKLAAEGKQYTWGQVAIAYLKNQDRLKVKKFTERIGMLHSPEHFSIEGPFTFKLSVDNAEDSNDSNDTESFTLYNYIPISEAGQKLKNDVIKQHLFNSKEVELAERVFDRKPFNNGDGTEEEHENNALFSIWASWAIKAKRAQVAERTKKALALQEAKEKSKTENARGKPNGWPYALTSQKFSDEERAEFAGNLEEFVNDIKYKAGAVIDHERKVVYINPDGSQVKLPNSLPVQLPAGAKMPMPTSRLKRIKDKDVLAQYGIVSIKNVLYSTANSQPVAVQDDALVIGDDIVPLESLREMTDSEILDNYRLFQRNGKYYSVAEKDRVTGPITEVLARGGEKIALPTETLDENGLQLLIKYTEQTTGQKLRGGQVHTYESDDDKIKMSGVYSEMLNNGASPKNAYEQAKKAVMREKLNSVAVQCLSGREQANPTYMHAAKHWAPRMIETIQSLGDKDELELIAENYGGFDNLLMAAKSGELDADDAKSLVDTYNVVTGTTPQQGAYIKPIMQDALLHGYQKDSTPGLPNNKFWHMMMSNAGRRFLDRKIDSESGNDLASQAMLHLIEKPESPLEGYDLHRILPKSSVALLEKTLKPEERLMQRANARYKTGKRTVVEEWQAKPLPRLLFDHIDWMVTPGIFPQEIIDQARELAGTELVKQERLKMFPDDISKMFPGATDEEDSQKTLEEKAAQDPVKRRFLNQLNYATAVAIVLQRQASQSEKHPQQDIWDIIMDEPGLDPASPQWNAKHKLAQHEAQIQKTSDAVQEQAKLREQLSIKSMFDVPDDVPVVQISNEEADAIIDQPMVNALTTSLLQSEDRDKISVLGKANRAMYNEATSSKSGHARGVVYPKNSVAVTSTTPLMITDEEGRERDVTGYTPEEYEGVHNEGEAPLYSDEKGLPKELLAMINKNTKNILQGTDNEEGLTFLGEFRQKLNKDLMGENQGHINRAQRAEAMYTMIYNLVSKSKKSLSDNEKRLARAEANNANRTTINSLKAEIENDTNILSMIESYDVFEHLSKMVHWGREFSKVVNKLEDLGLQEREITSHLLDRYPSAQQNMMAAARMYEPDSADELVSIGRAKTKYHQEIKDAALAYDQSAKELWNFLTRTTYMDKRNIAKLEAMGMGLNISQSGAEQESRLTQDDRDEVSNMVFDKLDKEARWFENPSNRIPAYQGSALGVEQPKKGEATVPIDSLTLPGDKKEIPNGINPIDLYKFLSRRGVLFALEMSKLDKISGRQKTAGAQGKYTQDFTQPKDMAWFVHNWLQNTHIPDGVLVPGANGLNTLDTAIGEIERRFAKPGGIYWSNAGEYNPLLEHADVTAMGYSLLAKYVDQFAKNSADKSRVNEFISAACDMIPKDVENIHNSVGYDKLSDDIKNKVDDAIKVAANAGKNPGLVDRLKQEYVNKKNQYVGTDKDNFSEAKTAVSMQIANHNVINELVHMSPDNQLFVNNGSEWAFGGDFETISAYIAHTIAQEVIASIKHLERPGNWELVGLSPIQIYTRMKPGDRLDVNDIDAYMSQRLSEFQKLLTSQWKVESISDMNEDGEQSGFHRDIKKIINDAAGTLHNLLYDSMGGGGQDIQVPLSHAMRELQSDAQLVNTKFQEDLYEKINDPSKDLRGVHDEHILPALRAANKDGVDLATAKAIRKWSAGELEWPLVTLGVKNNVREPAKGETPEAYAQYLASLANEGKKSAESLIGYGPSSVKRISASALRNDELAGKIHPMLSHQIAHRLDYLRNSDDYNAAVKNSEKAHFQNMKKKGQYGQYADVPPGSNKFVNGNIGVLSLDGLHPLHSYISGGYQVGRHGNAKDKRGLRQVAPEPQQVPNVPVQVPVDDAEKQAAVIDKLVRYALKLDAKGRFAEADLVDSLIHKLEVMV